MTIIQVADAQLGFDVAVKGQVPGAEYVNDLTYEIEYLTKAVQKINNLMPDVVVFTGDQVHLPNDAEQWENFLKIASQINESIKVFYLPGNHDVLIGGNVVNYSPFTNALGEDRFVYEDKGVMLLGINSSLIMAGDESEAQQKEWMAEQLSKGDPDDVKLVFGHHPFFVENIDEEDTYHQLPKAKRMEYFDIFTANGVDALYAGHLHESASGEYQGIKVRTTTSSAYQLGASKPSLRKITIGNGTTICDEFIEL